MAWDTTTPTLVELPEGCYRPHCDEDINGHELHVTGLTEDNARRPSPSGSVSGTTGWPA